METDDLPLVAKKYSTYYDDPLAPSHLLTKVCRQQIGLILEWCKRTRY